MMINKKPFLTVAALVTVLVLISLIFARNVTSPGDDPVSAGAPVNDEAIFLRVDTIRGESIARGHRDEIDILSFDWMEAMQSMSTSGAGIPTMSDFNFAMLTNRASPEIFLAVAKGTIYRDAKLMVCSNVGGGPGGPPAFLTWDFREVRFTSFSQSGTTYDNRPIEKFSIAFSWMRITYNQIDSSGRIVRTITKEWQSLFRLLVGVSGSGTTNATGTAMYNVNTVVVVNAIPEEGWTLDHWLLNGIDVGSANPYKVTMSQNYNLIAVFTVVPVQWTLTVNSDHDSPSPSVGSYLYNDGSSVTCNVSSPVMEDDVSYTCTGWTGTGSVPESGTDTSVTFTITQNSDITWNWIITPS